MSDRVHRVVDTNGLRMHVVMQGSGPTVLLCHGFPEFWYSWRSQLDALAAAGYRVVAPDMRGYGQTDQPSAIDQYSIFHLVDDMVGLLDALEVEQAVIIGHDWGSTVAWQAALMRPERFRAVGGLSVPFRPRPAAPPTTMWPQTDTTIFYQTYFQEPGVAEAEFERDLRLTLRSFQFLWSGMPTAPDGGRRTMLPRDGGFLTDAKLPPTLPAWLSEADIDFYAGEFARSGFQGPLNWYRNIDRNWEQSAPWHGAAVRVPALFMIGERDPVLTFRGMDHLVPNLEDYVPGLRVKTVVPECGHWIQREHPGIVNAALVDFLASLDKG